MSQLGLTDPGPETAAPVTPSPSTPATNYELQPCHDCGGLISRRAVACPHCGRPYASPVQLPSMGRIAGGVIVGYLGILVINFILLVIVFGFFAGLIDGLFPDPIPSRPSTSTNRF